MKSKTQKVVDYVYKYLDDCFRSYISKYDLNEDHITMAVFPYCYKDVDDLARYADGANAVTVLTGYVTANGIIHHIESVIYIPRERILDSYICFDCDYKLTATYYGDHILKHEFGHIIHANKSLIGKKEKDFSRYLSMNRMFEKKLPEVSEDALLSERIHKFLEYHSMPIERCANEMVGITKSEICYWEELRLGGETDSS